MSAETNEILEKLKKITLLEAYELVKQIEDTFGVDARISSTPSNTAISQSSVKVEDVAVEKTEFDVILNSVPSDKRVAAIKSVRTILPIGLIEAKEIIESCPKVILEGVSKEEAEKAKKIIESGGSEALIK